MANALDRPEKAQFHLVTFKFGSPEQTLRFTNWDSPIDPTGLNFVSLPSMEFDLTPNVGTFGEESTKLKMVIESKTQAFLDPLTRGTPFAQVKVQIEEIIDPAKIGDAGSTQFVDSGTIHRCRRNAEGKSGLCVLEVRKEKSVLDVSLAFQVNAHCVWRLNGVGCTEATHSPSGYVTRDISISIDGKVITINDPGLIFDLAGTRSWTRGFISFDGVNIGIFNYDKSQDGNTTKTFQLVRQPGVEWEGQVVTFFPGCTKQIDGDGGCRSAWDNEEGNGSSGYAIPAYHPVTENPAG